MRVNKHDKAKYEGEGREGRTCWQEISGDRVALFINLPGVLKLISIQTKIIVFTT